jgi:geranylgeranyl diphosphate synthase type II
MSALSTTAPVPITQQPWYRRLHEAFEEALAARLEALRSGPPANSRLLAAVEYSLRLPGKRLRPVLVLECCRVCGGAVENALTAAVAVECVHTFSLIHDDLPALDDDDLRRGQPCNHKVFGQAQALLAGDFLAVYPFELLTRSYPAPLASKLVETLADGTLGMIAGQAADCDGEGRPPDVELVQYIHRNKTGRLMAAACRMGALCAGAKAGELAALQDYGERLGLAFQITDDLLDVTGSAQKVGKQVAKDARRHKQTYPAAAGIEPSRQAAAAAVESAIAAVSPFGESAQNLRDLAHYVLTRDR